MFDGLICYFFHKRHHFWYDDIKLCLKCDHKGGGSKVRVLAPVLKAGAMAAAILALAACTAGPQCVKAHEEQKVGYHYGYGMVYQCHTTTYNKRSSMTTCGYSYGPGYVFGPYTETVCDAYATPSAKEN